jgi:hypothetical protein
MTYKKQLHPWSIVRSLEGGQKISVGRFRRYNDASSHLLFLCQMMPTLDHTIVFDPMDRLHADCDKIEAEESEPTADRPEPPQSEPVTTPAEVKLSSAKPKAKAEPVVELAAKQQSQQRSPGSLRLVE